MSAKNTDQLLAAIPQLARVARLIVSRSAMPGQLPAQLHLAWRSLQNSKESRDWSYTAPKATPPRVLIVLRFLRSELASASGTATPGNRILLFTECEFEQQWYHRSCKSS